MSAKVIDSTATRVASLSPQQLRELRERLACSDTERFPPLQPQPRTSDLPQSFAQERLWFMDQLTPTGTAYHMSASVTLEGVVDVGALEHSFTELIRRHETLRTRFDQAGGRAVQRIDPPGPFRLRRVDLSQLVEPHQSGAIKQWAGLEAHRPFDLHDGPLLRVWLLRLRQTRHLLQLTMHHIVSDGWSMTILLRDVSELYAACLEHRTAALPELPVQYADYAIWQRSCLRGEVLAQELSYWRGQLAGAPSLLSLPTDLPRPVVKSFRGAKLDFTLARELSDALRELGRSEGATLFMTLLAALKVLIARYSAQTDFVIGAPIAGRGRREVEDLIGFFVNTLPLRTDLSGNPSFRQLLCRVKEVVLGAFSHQDLPFEKVVAELQPQRDLSRQPLFQVMLALHNTPKTSAHLPGIGLAHSAGEHISAQFDLAVDMYDGAAVSGTLEYATDLFEQGTAQRMVGHFVKLLESTVRRPERCIWDLPLLTDSELRQVLAWSATAGSDSDNRSIHERFTEQAQRAPDAVAIVHGARQVTYGELERQSGRLARRLRPFLTGPETVVGVHAERSVEVIIGLLGIWKAGAVYLPLDPSQPPQRRAYLLRESGAEVLLCDSIVAADATIHQLAIVPSSENCAEAGYTTAQSSRLTVWPESLAYIIFTSGSTGKPKGVMISQGALANKIHSLGRRLRLQPGARSTLLAPVSVDTSIEQICLPLVHGGSLVIMDQPAQEAAAAFWQHIERQQVQVLDCVPSFLAAVVEVMPQRLPLAHLLVGGEKFPSELYRLLARHSGLRVTNIYGPTETTIDALAYEIIDDGRAELPIGTALDNYRCHILDPRGNPVPVGVIGEIYIGGIGLARGYLGRSDLTAQCFVPDPFGNSERLYRTGDRARYRADGNVEFLGRQDDQLKVRGHRVELAEVEAALREQSCVRRAVVLKELAEAGDVRLRAFVVPDVARLDANGSIDRASLSQAIVHEWTALFDNTYDSHTPGRGPTFQGWISSYTGELIPHCEMQEWLDTSVQRILAQAPKRVLEIGCGDGLILQHLAPRCETYIGTDISSRVITDLEQWITGRKDLQHVKLSCRDATDLRDVPAGSVDTVVINSVVQYFPDVSYLVTVLGHAVAATAAGGRVFIGDVRDLKLLRTFHTSVQLAKANPALSLAQLRRRIARSLAHEKELALDPRLFRTLQEYFPRVQDVEILLKRGLADNELTRYRYDVVLHLDRITRSPAVISLVWRAGQTPEEVGAVLASRRPPSVFIRSVPNRRVRRDSATCELINTRDERSSVMDLSRELASLPLGGEDPESFWRLGEAQGYRVTVSWSDDASDGSFDVLLTDCLAAAPPVMAAARLAARSLDRTEVLQQLGDFANEMMTEALQYELSVFLKDRLRHMLPEAMVPSSISLVTELPLTAGGKLDRDGLLALLDDTTRVGERHEPASAVQRTLADIWRKLLRLENLALEDDFFELGGHSLMAMRLVAHVREELAVALPVRVVFEQSTLGELSTWIESERDALERAAGGLPHRLREKLAGLSADEAAALMRELQVGSTAAGPSDVQGPRSLSHVLVGQNH